MFNYKAGSFAYAAFVPAMSFLLFLSCNRIDRQNQEKAVVVDTTITAPKPISNGYSKKIACLSDQSQTYDLYLPSSYDSKKAFPLIFIFDAHASGELPVKLYSDLAESFGYILMGSNNSKNGQDQATSNKIYQEMLADARQRLVLDERRLYTMGFSGGARVAAAVAIANGGIAGVIGCSAGFQQNAAMSNNFNFIGLAGNEDFNLAELKALDESLNQTAMRHQLIIYNGKHAWCDTTTMKEAFYWITFNAMRNQLLAVDDSLIKKYISEQDMNIKKLEREHSDYHIFECYRKVVNFLDGLYDISAFKVKLSQLEHSDKIRAYNSYLNRIASEEKRLQQQYSDFMVSRELSWWKAEVNHLNESIRADKKREEALFKKRLLSYMSLMSYNYSNKALAANALSDAAKFIAIYALVDPPNAEHAYLEAVLMMKYNNPGLAINALKEAVKLGFHDEERMRSEPEFYSMQNDSAFVSIVHSMD